MCRQSEEETNVPASSKVNYAPPRGVTCLQITESSHYRQTSGHATASLYIMLRPVKLVLFSLMDVYCGRNVMRDQMRPLPGRGPRSVTIPFSTDR